VLLLGLFISTIIIFCVSYVYFGLLTKFNYGIEYFVILAIGDWRLAIGGAILILFI
tara:strand:+ start:9440 stop:9607 length:168 start_codon:yes stop_codon:yes gene_type:complete